MKIKPDIKTSFLFFLNLLFPFVGFYLIMLSIYYYDGGIDKGFLNFLNFILALATLGMSLVTISIYLLSLFSNWEITPKGISINKWTYKKAFINWNEIGNLNYFKKSNVIILNQNFKKISDIYFIKQSDFRLLQDLWLKESANNQMNRTENTSVQN